MRKVVLGLGISLDGYIARKNGAVDWLSVDWDYDWMAFFNTIDTVIMGRRSWDKYLEMTPDVGKNPYEGMKTFVFSKKIRESGVDGVEMVDENPEALVRQLKSEKGKKIWLSGGGELASAFLEADLVDELYLGVTPILIGSGIPLFPEFNREIPLKLVENNSCYNKEKTNAMLELTYEVVRD
ncbi:MAG: dihydrofolate reductase [Acidobacteria bacterium]|nr:MAG: dihydrofolate reductase [Acidobacteriota bacterium]REJ98915.1 MAG: dihydrofolate reductase [Acidobacteriota bacterium]REK16366.1 MAG: dihydrofolate reductase [Acidobacteriota bacterium]REK44047.1 MAG: dihydrofolate reductase [Acidobacteriota bacterium]